MGGSLDSALRINTVRTVAICGTLSFTGKEAVILQILNFFG
jgi:hypothetical protein